MTSIVPLSLLSRDEAPGVVTGAVSCVGDGQEGPDVRHRGGRDRGHAQHQQDGACGPPGNPQSASVTYNPQARGAAHFRVMTI